MQRRARTQPAVTNRSAFADAYSQARNCDARPHGNANIRSAHGHRYASAHRSSHCYGYGCRHFYNASSNNIAHRYTAAPAHGSAHAPIHPQWLVL